MTYGPTIPYMECGNLVTVNDWTPIPYMECYGPHTYMECGNLVIGSPTCMIWFECRNLVTVSDLWFPHTLYGIQELCNGSPTYKMHEPCNRVPSHVQCGNLVTINDLWSPIPYMQWYGPPFLYGMWEPCNGVPYMYDIIWMQELCNCQWLMIPQYLIWNSGTL